VSGTPEEADRGGDNWRRILPVLPVLAGAIAYANGLSGPFVFDDIGSIVENAHLHSLWPLSEALSAPPQATVAGRPLVSLSLALNYALGGLDVRGYHLTNLAIHLLCGLALFGVVHRTLGISTLTSRYGRRAPWLASACALLWLVHPLCTEVVDYTVQRTESIMALCYLVTLYAAVRAAAAARPGGWSVVAVAACAAGMASKEVMVTAPVAVVLFDLAYQPGSIGRNLRRRWGLYAGLASTWAILAVIMAMGPRAKTVGVTLGISALDYAANQGVLVVEYLKAAVWPHPLVIDYGYARPLPEGVATPFVLAVAALVIVAALLFWRRPTVGYPALWVFLVLAPTSSFVPIVSEVGAERRMYLPLAGLVVLLVVLGDAALDRAGRDASRGRRLRLRVAGAVAVGLIAVLFTWATQVRNRDYRTAETLWRTGVAARPENPRAHNNLGRAVHLAGRAEEAIAHYERALVLDGSYGQAHFNLGVALADLGRPEEAQERYRRALALNPELARAHHNLGAELANRGRMEEAVDHFREAVRLDPESPSSRQHLGRALRFVGATAEAVAELREAIRLAPDQVEALGDLAWIRATAVEPEFRDGSEAVRLAERALGLTGDRRAVALDTLAAALAEVGRFGEAVRVAEEARAAASNSGADELRREIEERVLAYAEGKPFRE